jgi:hypothetical protein
MIRLRLRHRLRSRKKRKDMWEWDNGTWFSLVLHTIQVINPSIKEGFHGSYAIKISQK